MKLTNFLKANRGVLILSGVYFIVFACLAWLTGLSEKAYLISIGLCLVSLIFYLYSQISNYQQCLKQMDQLAHLKDHNQNLVDELATYQAEIEEYFLLWAHQIKTPITAANLLLSNAVDSPDLQDQIKAIDNYTNQALNYLKVVNPQTDMRLDEYPLDDIIQPLIMSYRKQFIYHNIQLDYRPLKQKVLTDSKLAQVMIEQILNNALKYIINNNSNSDDADRKIRIDFDNKTNALEITDTGQGIKAEDLPKIFDRGYTGFNGRVHERATGIGLYLVKKISQRLNVDIHVQSTYQKGTTFSLSFPHP